MASLDITAPQRGKKGSLRRCKKLSTRIDLTPMVDLGFLLITFFMVSMTWSKLKAMKIVAPSPGPPMNISEKISLTLIPLKNNTVFFYRGSLQEALRLDQYGTVHYDEGTGVGLVIRKMQLQLDQDISSGKGRKDLFVTIKPTSEADFGDVIKALDEMTINDVKSFALSDPSGEELSVLRAKKLVS